VPACARVCTGAAGRLPPVPKERRTQPTSPPPRHAATQRPVHRHTGCTHTRMRGEGAPVVAQRPRPGAPIAIAGSADRARRWSVCGRPTATHARAQATAATRALVCWSAGAACEYMCACVCVCGARVPARARQRRSGGHAPPRACSAPRRLLRRTHAPLCQAVVTVAVSVQAPAAAMGAAAAAALLAVVLVAMTAA